MEVYLTRPVASRRFPPIGIDRYHRSGFAGYEIERSDCDTTLWTLRGLQRLCVKFEAAETILAYGFVGRRIEEINKHKLLRVSGKIV